MLWTDISRPSTAISTIAAAFVFLSSAMVSMCDTAQVIVASGVASTSDCETSVAVANPANNPGLVSDCEVLQEARDTLTGTAILGWSAVNPITRWKGVTFGGTPSRVAELYPREIGLAAEVSADLGNLPALGRLSLCHNRLSGEMPAVLANAHIWNCWRSREPAER